MDDIKTIYFYKKLQKIFLPKVSWFSKSSLIFQTLKHANFVQDSWLKDKKDLTDFIKFQRIFSVFFCYFLHIGFINWIDSISKKQWNDTDTPLVKTI